jgi:OFA family oxalate/formate antiporter-like MFS transporter
MGVIGGTGLGLSYVTPVATVSRWFPDKKGLATGMVIMGFGLGALFMSKILAPAFLALEARDLSRVFRDLGLLLGLLSLGAALFLRNPPQGWTTAAKRPGGPAGPSPKPARATGLASSPASASRAFILIWLVFFCNITAGIALIGFQSPLLQDLLRKGETSLTPEALAALGATLIAMSSLFNGVGRLLWGALIDRLGGAATFRVMLAGEILAYGGLLAMSLGAGIPLLFGALVCYVLLCYGGGFGAMPAFIGEAFGPERLPSVYGAVLTAWSVAGIAGPQIVAGVKDRWPASAGSLSFAIGLGLLLAGFGLSWLLPRRGPAKG